MRDELEGVPAIIQLGIQDLGLVLIAQLTALRDEHPSLLSRLVSGRTLSNGVDRAGLSLADLFAGSSTVMDRKEPAHYTSSEACKAGLFANPQKQPKATTTRLTKPNGRGCISRRCELE